MDFSSTAVHSALVAVAETSADGIVLVDADSIPRYVNPAGLTMLGLGSVQDVRADLVTAMNSPGFAARFEHIEQQVEESGLFDGPIGLVSRGGRRGTVGMSIFRLSDEPHTAGWRVVVLRDLRSGSTRERDLREAMHAVAVRAREQDAIADLNRIALSGEFEKLSAAAVETIVDMLGVEHAMMYRPSASSDTRLAVLAGIGPHREKVLSTTFPAGAKSMAGYALSSKSIVECADRASETRFDTAVMEDFGLHSAVAVPVLTGDSVWGVLVAYRDMPHSFSAKAVTFVAMVAEVVAVAVRRADLERELLYQSLHDPLTHLANRTLAYQRIDEALERSRSDSAMTAVMLIDLHDFRTINDSLGHGAGDAVLSEVAPLLTESVRMGDTVARFGGDEFMVVCSDLADSFDAMAVAQKIVARFRRPMTVGEREVEISACVGVAVGHGEDTAAEVVRPADIAVGEAKKEGPATVHVFDYEQGGAALRRLTVASALRSALDEDALTLVYQPVFDLGSGEIVAVEALARWHDSPVGEIGPAEFVPAAERSGLILPLGEWALHTACVAAARWQAIRPVDVRVNVSPLQLRHPGFTGTVERILAETGLSAKNLGIEITESIWVEDTATVRRNLTAMHDMGVSILLDDFGVGHSSMNYLKRFPILDCVKIDRSFVTDLPERQASSIVQSIISIARAFDLDVVGEGVENAEQLDALRASGCFLGQGFFLAEPVPHDAVWEYLEQGARTFTQ